MILFIALILLMIFSFFATLISLILMLSPEAYQRLEDAFSSEFGGAGSFNTALEGKINIVNDWILRNRLLFGPLFTILAALNTRNAFLFFNLRP